MQVNKSLEAQRFQGSATTSINAELIAGMIGACDTLNGEYGEPNSGGDPDESGDISRPE